MKNLISNIKQIIKGNGHDINEPVKLESLLGDSMPVRVNIKEYAYKKAGKHYGDAKALLNLLQQILKNLLKKK